MKSDDDAFLDGLTAVMSERGLKDAPLAERAGLGISYIRDLRRRKAASPKLSNALRIATALGMSIESIMDAGQGRRVSLPTIAIAGQVGAGAQVQVFDAYEKGAGPQVVRPADLPASSFVAVEVTGDSMEPVYSQGDLLFYARDAHDGVPDDVIGHRCVCEDQDGNGWIKQLRRGSEPGLFNLISLNPSANNQHDVRLKWAARVRLHLPADLARRL